VDAGLLIHEGQITYGELNLQPVVNLGEWWYSDTGLPVPLGINAIRKDLGPELTQRIVVMLNQSIQYAMQHRRDAVAYAMRFGRGMDAATTDRFVGMYVNSWTLDMGKEGRASVECLLERGHRTGVLPKPVRVELVK
jgi:1,4-dihydroxy-6-naphthoate synthase